MNKRVAELIAALKAMRAEDLTELTDPELNATEILLNAWSEEVGQEYERRSRYLAGVDDPDDED